MAKAKPEPKNPFVGSWRIVSMPGWDEDYLDEEVQAYLEIDARGLGSFQFGYVQGQVDCQFTSRDGKPAAEFSWEGGDGADGTPMSGRGWAILEGDRLEGMIFIHQSDSSDFVAERDAKKPTRKKS